MKKREVVSCEIMDVLLLKMNTVFFSAPGITIISCSSWKQCRNTIDFTVRKTIQNDVGSNHGATTGNGKKSVGKKRRQTSGVRRRTSEKKMGSALSNAFESGEGHDLYDNLQKAYDFSDLQSRYENWEQAFLPGTLRSDAGLHNSYPHVAQGLTVQIPSALPREACVKSNVVWIVCKCWGPDQL